MSAGSVHALPKRASKNTVQKRLNLWVPANIYDALANEANQRGLTITACVGLKLAERNRRKTGAKEGEDELALEQIKSLKEKISKLESEQANTDNLRTLCNRKDQNNRVLLNQRNELLQQKANLEEINHGWQAKSAQDEQSLQQVDFMLKRLNIIKAGHRLDEETQDILNYVLLGKPAPQPVAKNGKKQSVRSKGQPKDH